MFGITLYPRLSALARFALRALTGQNDAMSDVTRILSQIESGDPSAAARLLPLV
jgi:hypothetical protein